MSINVSGFAPVAAHDLSDARESRRLDDASSESFAGILSNTMQARTPVAPAPKRHEGTSELEAHKDADEANETQSASHDDEESSSGVAKTQKRRAVKHSEVVRSLDELDPTLQDKLATVMSRVKEETGLDVNVEETFRSQSRQDSLFAQGRETPGPVVTWTHNSQHTAGRAVDLVLSGANGTNVLPSGYAALQRIAQEEGLHTLGARDPGHLELPATGARAARDTTSLIPAEPADASGRGQVSIAQVAQLARIATVNVAQPAQVARVATVGRPDAVAQDAKPVTTGAPSTTSPAGVSGADAGGSSQRYGAGSSGRDSRSGSGNGDRSLGVMAAAVAMRQQAAGVGGTGFSIPGVAATLGSSAPDRVAKLLDAIDSAPIRPLSQITMSVDAGNGSADKVQLSLRGATLNASIDTMDTRAAQAMTSRSDELVRALTRDGIDLQSLHVRSTTATNASAATVVATTSSQQTSENSTNARSERGQAWQQFDRDRSQQQDRRNQRRDQRGGQAQ